MQEMFDEIVTEFMKEDGFIAHYIKRKGEYNPALGEVVQTTRIIPVRALVMDLSLQRNGLSSKFGTEILAGDKEMFIQPPLKTLDGGVPLLIDTTTDAIRIGTVEYTIVSMREINTTGTNPILYNLFIRR